MARITPGNIHRRLWILHDHGFPTLRQFEAEIAIIMAELDELDTTVFSFLYPMVYRSFHFTEQEKVALFRRLVQLDVPYSNARSGPKRIGYTSKMRTLHDRDRFPGLFNPFNQPMLEVLLAAGYIPESHEVDWKTLSLDQFVWMYERLSYVSMPWKCSVLTQIMKRPDLVAYVMDYEGWDLSNFYHSGLADKVMQHSEFRSKYMNRVMLFRDANQARYTLTKVGDDISSLEIISIALDYLKENWHKLKHAKDWRAYRDKYKTRNAFEIAANKCIKHGDMGLFIKVIRTYLRDGHYTSYRYTFVLNIVGNIVHQNRLNAWSALMQAVTNPHMLDFILKEKIIRKTVRKEMNQAFSLRFGREPSPHAREHQEVPEIDFYEVEAPPLPNIPRPPRGKKPAARRAVPDDNDSE